LFAQQDWHRTGVPVCGKILFAKNGRTKPAKSETVQVYKSRGNDAICCAQAELALELKTNRSGNFLINKLDEGNYFLVLKDSAPPLTIPISVPKAYEQKTCDIDQRFTVDAATGKSEVTVTIEVD
jgi:hypothetical protein